MAKWLSKQFISILGGIASNAMSPGLAREKSLHIIVNILCVGSMRFIAIYMYAENPYTTEISLHIHSYCSYMYTMDGAVRQE